MILRLAILAGLILFTGSELSPASAQETRQVGAIEVSLPWARATAPRMQAGAAFVTLYNTGSEDDRLIAAAAPVADVVELHTHLMDGDIMRMRPVDDIPLPAGETVRLKPGGLHIMMIGLTERLVEGTDFPLTLTFEKAGRLEITVPVEAIGAPGPSLPAEPMGHHGSGHEHGHP